MYADDEVTPDGSPIPVYLALAAEPSFTPVLDRLPAGASVLDLGCGVGRLANLLADRGHRVVGADESAAMLPHVDARAETVQAPIEGLDLRQRFDAVVLASHLVNTADRRQRSAFLDAVARHLALSGEAYLQHHDVTSERHEVGTTTQTLATAAGDLEVTTTVHERRGTWLRATTRMTLDGDSWDQHYETALLDASALGRELDAAGLEVVARPSPTWTIAVARA